MKKKTFEVSEPTVLYQARVHTGISSTVPFNGTQAEWNEHFQQIESGEFKSLDVANEEFREWKKTLLATTSSPPLHSYCRHAAHKPRRAVRLNLCCFRRSCDFRKLCYKTPHFNTSCFCLLLIFYFGKGKLSFSLVSKW